MEKVVKLFIASFVTLIFFNLIAYIIGLSGIFLTPIGIIGLVLTVVAIGILASLIPLVNGTSFTWVLTLVMMIALLFSVNIPFGVWTLPVGLGLCSNLMNMFPVDLTNPLFAGYLFFLTIGSLGIIGAISATSSGS